MITTEEQLQKIRLLEIREYLLVGCFIGLFSGVVSLLIKPKVYAAYFSVSIVVLLYIAFEAYRVQGEILLYHFLQIEYLAFLVSGFAVIGIIQYSGLRYREQKIT